MRLVKWKGRDAVAVPVTYAEGNRVALALYEVDRHPVGGAPLAVATVNLPEYPLPKDCAFFKVWSENEGLFEALIEAGIIEDTGRSQPVNRVVARVGRFLVPVETLDQEAKAHYNE